ncbi:MMPL family transporter [Bacillus sp. 2205SS5-2]|uniref:MMPL family transporter n=1 Tax=Bacillus sp. 2205SS5-2 TaxID=3109031 RepID=UPI003004CEDE
MNRFGRMMYRYRKWMIVLWVLMIGFFAFFAMKLPSVLSGNGFEYDGEFKQTMTVLEKDFGQYASSIIVLFENEQQLSEEEFGRSITSTLSTLGENEQVEKVVTPFMQEGMKNENFAYGLLLFNEVPGELTNTIEELSETLTSVSQVKVSMTGEPVIVKDLNEASQEDLAKAETIGLPIALLVLILAFGGLVAASIPLVIGVISILMTMGIVYFFSYATDLSIFILNIVPMIGLALSIDFALLLINRFKEEIQTKSTEEAIQVTIATAGRSIIFSGLCVFIGLFGLMFIQIDIFQNVGLGGMTVVLVSVLAALTFLPAILSMVGPKINALRIFKLKDGSSTWERFAKVVMKRPIVMALLSLAVLVTALIPLREMNLAIPSTNALPENYESRTAFETFEQEFIDENKRVEKQVEIVAEGNGEMLSLANLEMLQALISEFEKDPLVQTVESPFSLANIADAETFVSVSQQVENNPLTPILDNYFSEDKVLLSVYLDPNIEKEEGYEWVKKWSEKNSEFDLLFGGQLKFEQEIFQEIFDKAPYGLALILISTFIILAVAFRSLIIPLKAIIMNILSLSATFGMIVWIFQGGHFGLPSVDIALVLPVFVFSLVFGLSMDYEVFLISRIHEVYLETQNNDEAIIKGLTSTSKIITSAAAIMIVVTGAFAFTGVMPVKQMGVGIALAIFIDATIVRMILVPALMKLLGNWNWWFFGFKFNQSEKVKLKEASE